MVTHLDDKLASLVQISLSRTFFQVNFIWAAICDHSAVDAPIRLPPDYLETLRFGDSLTDLQTVLYDSQSIDY